MYGVTENSVVVSRPGCSQMFFLYTGVMRAVFGEDPVSFLRNTGLGDRNFAVFRDPQHCSYRRGIGDDVDSLDALAEFQANLLRDMKHVASTYHIGVCGGGVPAVYCGATLGANEVWSFAMRAVRPGDHAARFNGDIDPLATLLPLDDLYDFEFAAVLGARAMAAPPSSRFGAYYAQDDEVDRRFAELLGASGRITLHPMPRPPEVSNSHNVVGLLRRRGELGRMFPPVATV